MRNQVQIKILTYETTLILYYVYVYLIKMPPRSKDIAPIAASQDVGRIGKLQDRFTQKQVCVVFLG